MSADTITEQLSSGVKQNGRCKTDLESMSNREILSAVRAMEAAYKKSFVPIDVDHRMHLTREELENVYGLVSRTLELRRIDFDSLARPRGMRHPG